MTVATTTDSPNAPRTRGQTSAPDATALVGDTPQTRRVLEIIAPALTDAGLSVVRVMLRDDARVLQIMIERGNGDVPTIDDCAAASRTVSALLDVADPIPGAYTLEVSSPGIDRPLTRLADFGRFAGFEAKVEMNTLRDGRRRYRGQLLGTDADAVRLAFDGAEVALPYADIRRAKLVLTDELLAAAGDAN